MKKCSTILIFTHLCLITTAQLDITVVPLTDQIIQIHYNEGEINYHKNGESTSNDLITTFQLETDVISEESNYSLQSDGDPNYLSAKNPMRLGRKSKGTSYANYCEAWEYLPLFDMMGCSNSAPDNVSEHWIYLVFENALRTDETYQVEVKNIDDTGPLLFEINFQESDFESDAIHINNIGYSTGSPFKFAYVYHWLGDIGNLDLSDYEGAAFQLEDQSTGNSVFSGEVSFRKDADNIETGQNDGSETLSQNFLGAEVYECDFSDFNTPGTYRIVVDGIGASNEFIISCNAYEPAFISVMSGIFQNRSGIEIPAEYTNQPRPADHNPILTPGFSGRLKYTSTTICEVSDADANSDDKAMWESGYIGTLEAWGWYQDAGDWDAYLRHMNVPTKLLFLYNAFPENFNEDQLRLLESQNDLPDVLDEARWLIRFYKRLKDETEANSWTSGGVPGARIFGDLWGDDLPGDIGRGSWQDTDRDWYVSGEDPVATYWYAGATAHFAYVLQKFGLEDPESINWESEARDAYAWADINYEEAFECHSSEVEHVRNYAAAALFLLSSESSFSQDFENSWNKIGFDNGEAFDGEKAFGGFLYTESVNSDPGILQKVEEQIESTSDFYLLNTAESRACRWGGNLYFPMLVGHGTSPKVFEAVMGYHWIKDKDPAKGLAYLGYLHTTADYFLGTNPLKMTWISGFDENSPKEIFHLDDRYSDNPNVRQGVVPYGPWKNENLFNSMGPFNHNWPIKDIYPNIESWPGHERYFGSRYSPLTGEFTIEETNLNAAILYGALSGASNCAVSSPTSEVALSQTKFSLFPNPTTNLIFLENEKRLKIQKIEIYNMTGNLISAMEYEDFQESQIAIDVKNLIPAIYIIKVLASNQAMAMTFVKS